MKGTAVPQADRLDRVRTVVQAVARGATTQKLVATVTGVSSRHVAYAVHAARVLGLLEDSAGALRETKAGRQLLESEPDTRAEARRIEALAGLAPATARRRAQALLAWRARLLGTERQESLFRATPHAEHVLSPSPGPGLAALWLRGLQVERFGPLRAVAVPLRPFMALIGRNATGKSSTLDTLSFVADCLEHDAPTAM